MKILVIVPIITILFAFSVRAEVLGTAEFHASFANFSLETNLPMIILYPTTGHQVPDGDGGSYIGTYCTIKFDARLTEEDIDTILVADPEIWWFECMEGNLTDNYGAYVGMGFFLPGRVSETSISGIYYHELEQIAFSLPATDFHGADITSISVRLDHLSLGVVESWRGTELIDVDCSVTLIIEGTYDVAVESSTWGAIKTQFSD